MPRDDERAHCRCLAAMLMRAAAALAAVSCLWAPARARGQESTTSDRAEMRDTVVVPGPHYRAGWLHRIFLGGNYRDLWTTPVTVDVLRLDSFAGGLTPFRRGGGQQTKSLRFRGADGRQYTFRTLEKDPTPGLPPELRATIASRMAKDYTSAIHPGGPLVVAPLVRAAGVLQPAPRLVVLADDPLLGEFRSEFAGRLGWIDERADDGDWPSASFAGASEVVSTEALFARIERSPGERVDAPAFLTARLVDLFVGDWDRHHDQWRWAKLDGEGGTRWVPVPRDRDYAFSLFQGLVVRVARVSHPEFLSFGPRYPGMLGLTWQGRELDRRLLVELERPVWDSVARAVQARLTDSVIDAATQELPDAFRRRHSAELAGALKQRRDALPAAADRFYRLLAGEVNVHATDQSELAEVRAVDDRHVEVTLYAPAAGGAPYFRRRFGGGETREVRLFMHGGADRVVVGSGGGRGPAIRVIGGGGNDDVVDSSANGARVYDERGDNKLTSRAGRRIDPRRYEPPVSPKGPHDVPRDWGSEWHIEPWLSYSSDLGLLVGGGPVLTRFGFRQHPFATRLGVRAGYATGARDYRVEARGTFRRVNSDVFSTVRAVASGLEILRFHGFGNGTRLAPGPRNFYKVRREEWLLEPALVLPLAPHARLALGPTLKYGETDTPSGRFITATSPYGVGRFGQAGARARAVLDTRDQPSNASRGVLLSVDADYYPELWDVARPFGVARAEAATYLTAPIVARPTLALRVGGRRTWGTYPFHEASFVGGDSTVRGYGEQRFAGDASVYGKAELRLFLARLTLIVPADVGVFGLADAGRVYVSGDSSNAWHTAAGGGVWIAPFTRATTFSVAVARSTERTGFYFRTGFGF